MCSARSSAGLSQNAGMLIACRVVQGIGVGGLSALAQIVMAAMISPRERGRYSGYLGATFAVATVGGPLLGGVITDTDWLGWRWCFYVGVPFAIIALIVLQKTLKLPVVKRDVKVDWAGAFFISAAVSLLLVWVTFAGDKYDWLSWQTYAMVGGSIVLGAALRARRVQGAASRSSRCGSSATAPSPWPRSPRSSSVSRCSAGTVFFSQYFQLARDKSPTMSGVMTIPMIAGLFISSTVSGQVITKTGSWKAWLVTGGVLVTAGLGLLGTMRYDTEYWHIAIFMALHGSRHRHDDAEPGARARRTRSTPPTSARPAPSSPSSAPSAARSASRRSAPSWPTGSPTTSRTASPTSAPRPRRSGHGGTGGGGIPDLDALPAPLRTVMESAYGHGIADVFLYRRAVRAARLPAHPVHQGGPAADQGRARTGRRVRGRRDAPAARPTATAEEPVPAPRRAHRGRSRGHPALAAVATSRPVDAAGRHRRRIPVRGFVRGAESAPVPRAAVTLISLGGRQLGRSVAQADGSYAVDAPGAGSYVLIASADGFQPQASTVVVGDEPVAYDILLSGTSGLTGVVRAAQSGDCRSTGAMVDRHRRARRRAGHRHHR